MAGILVSGDGSEIPGKGVYIGQSPESPRDLRTTLDVSVQLVVERVLDERGVRKGAAVVLDVVTGEILAMASRPQFDQNHPEESFNDKDAPFVNRAIAAFAPGSTWKPVVLAAALETGLVQPKDTFTCQGSFKVGESTISCGADEKKHGSLTPAEALSRSCNCTFAEMALKLDARDLVQFAAKAGFGQKTGIPLPEEAPGVLPDPGNMFPGDVANFAIGQGYLTVTPLQLASFFGAVARGGIWVKPRLIMADPEEPKEEKEEKRIFSEETASYLRKALLLSTSGTDVTGKLAWVRGYGSSGKTGTAETGGEGQPPHAWFCGWTPVIEPKYAICVFVENGGYGPLVASPIFKEIAEKILYPGGSFESSVVP